MASILTRLRTPLTSFLRNRNSTPLFEDGGVVFGEEEEEDPSDAGNAISTTTTIQQPHESGFVSGDPSSSSPVSSSTSPAASDSSSPSAGTSWYVAVFLVVNAALGSALLNFPQAFDAAGGVAAAIGVQTVLFAVALASLVILAFCAETNGAATYQDVVKDSLGKIGHLTCSICVVLYCFGTCVTFLIIIGDQWDRYFFSFDPLFCHYWWKRRTFTMTVSSFCLILPLCFSKRIDFLKYVSAFGVATIFYINFLQVYKFYDGVPESAKGPVKTAPDHWTDIFLVMPTIFFGYQCHVSAVPIYSCLRRRSVAEFLKTVLTAMLACMITYSIGAIYGYLTFGSKVFDDILSNYDANDPLVSAALIVMALKTYTSYPLLIFCGRTGVDSLWVKLRGLSPPQAQKGEVVRRVITVLTWFTGSIFAAIYIPGIDSVIPILGACASAFIVIFPGLCLLMLVLKEEDDEGEARRKLSMGPVSRTTTPPPVDVVGTVKGSKLWRRRLFMSTAVAMVVFGAFILGIIIANSFEERETKIALCY